MVSTLTLALDAICELSLVNMAGKLMSHPVITMGTHSPVQVERVDVKVEQFFMFTKLIDVKAAALLWDIKGHHRDGFLTQHAPATDVRQLQSVYLKS